jgi:hypothetical protein
MAKGARKLPRIPRIPRPAIVCVVILLVAIVAAVIVPMFLGREGLKAHKSTEPTIPGAVGLPDTPKNQLPTMKEQKKMFPGVPWGNTQGGQQVNPQAPSSALEQTLGYLQSLGRAPSESAGTGASVTSTTLIAGVDGSIGGTRADGAGASAGMPYGASDPKGAAATASSTHGHGSSTHGHTHQTAQSALPKGIPKSKIPKGQEDLYILKSEIVPPVCPACPACPACPKPVCPKPDPSQCPPCPAPGRCPPPAFGCQRVPLYQNMNSGILPSMI